MLYRNAMADKNPQDRFVLTPEQVGPGDEALTGDEMRALLDKGIFEDALALAKKVKAAAAAGRELTQDELDDVEYYSARHPDLFEGILDG